MMNNPKQSDNNPETFGPTTLISAAKLHETKSQDYSLPPELAIDPLYTPLIEAVEAMRSKIESKTKHKIEKIKKETAEQTQDLYYKVTQARQEFKQIEKQLQEKKTDIIRLQNENNELQIQQQRFENHQDNLNSLVNKHADEVEAITLKNNALIEQLKDKFEQSNQDFTHQLANWQQKLKYEQQRLNNEIEALTDENHKITEELTELRQEKNLWQQGSGSFEEKIHLLEANNKKAELTIKEKSEKLLRAEHRVKLANEELERSQHYIKELEEKNNSIQKELFENWIHKKDGF